MAKDTKGVEDVPPRHAAPPSAPTAPVTAVPTAAAAKAPKKKAYRASDDMRIVGRIQKELETLPRHAQEKVMHWIQVSMGDGTIKAVPNEEPRPDQPPLPGFLAGVDNMMKAPLSPN